MDRRAPRVGGAAPAARGDRSRAGTHFPAPDAQRRAAGCTAVGGQSALACHAERSRSAGRRMDNPKVVQSTMASLARVNVWYDEAGDWLQEQEAPLLAAALDGVSLYEYEAPGSGILLIGNESKGLHPELMERATQKITIPRIGGAESLNAAVATGIIVSHLVQNVQ
ncbi:MAG: hypothetical protein EOO12_13780 [Chitinophagaceae bacterium]|nr:MAG: hypothetical protein EOO12_13780 [Chitinophagaceae bacterium]